MQATNNILTTMVAYFCPLHASYFSTDYVNMQDNYVNMQDKYVDMRDNYVNMQLIYVNMQLIMPPPPLWKRRAYCFAPVGRYVGMSVGRYVGRSVCR